MAKDKKLDLLKEVPLFWGCTDKELKAIGAIADSLDRPAGAVLMKEGDPGQELFIIAHGTARISKNGRKIRSAGPGEAIGELSLLDQGPRSATVTAETPVTVYVVGSRSFATLLHDAPTVGVKLLKSMAKRLRAAEKSAAH